MKKINYIIGPESEYDENTHSDTLYVCNDSNNAYIPSNISDDQEIIEWDYIKVPFNPNNPDIKPMVYYKQVGDLVNITGTINGYFKAEEGDVLFSLPDNVGKPITTITMSAHSMGSAQTNRGYRVQLDRFGDFRLEWRHGHNEEPLYINETYFKR